MATKARNRQKKQRPRSYGRLLLMLLVVASLAGIGYFVFLQAPLFTPPAAPVPTTEAPPAQAMIPTEEPLATPPAEALPPEPAASSPAPAAAPVPMPTPEASVSGPAAKTTPPVPAPAQVPTRKKPVVAIIIDDMGYQPAVGRQMLALPLSLSFSFLPFGPHTKELAAAAQSKGRDIMLHLPLEATDRALDPGPGTLRVAMDDQELGQRFAEDLATVPMAMGLNNHMGSRFTEQRPAMTTLLTQVKQRGLFFLDSRTSSKSVGCEVAKEVGVPCLSRHLFLDNDQDKAKIIAQLDALLALAEKNGMAVGIGHPHPTTLAALTARRQALTDRVELVGIGTLFRTHGR